MSIKTDLLDQDMVVEAIKTHQWPPPTLAAIKNNLIKVKNTTNSLVLLEVKHTLSLKLAPTTNSSISDPPSSTQYYNQYSPQPVHSPPDSETIQLIKFGKREPELKAALESAYRQYHDVFNKDLSNGYNRYYGRHLCNLNWTLQQRPTARKVPIVSYSHDLKGVMQEICDKLTDQGVLKVPQHHNIIVQSVCPSFLRRKRKPWTHLLTCLLKMMYTYSSNSIQ